MKENNVVELSGRAEAYDALTALLRSGAKELIRQAVDAELQELLASHADRLTDAGRAGVVRNGFLPERQLQTGIGPVTVKIPKVRAKTGEPVTFRSALVPPYVRKTRTLEAALPWLYLKGVSSGEMGEALQVLVGPEAQGLSASTVSRLKQVWAQEYQSWSTGRLDRDRWVYIWADGVYSGLRAEQTKLCALVIIGVNERGEKHFLSIEDGVRESTQSWREVLLKLKSRGMNAPQLAIGDGAMGFWAALEEIYGETRQQRCWMHTSPWMDEVERRRKPKPKTMNVLNCFPKSSQAKAKGALHAIWQAETKADAETAFDLFVKTYEAKYPKATLSLQKDREELMAFYDFPAQHWQSIRTSNPIESSFATIRHRTKRSKGCLSRDGMLHMMFKLGQCAEKNWRRLRGFDYLAKVVSGIKFKDGIEVTEVNQAAA
jgi:putative transposase